MNKISNQTLQFYDIVGARILILQDRLASLSLDDSRRATVIAILTEFDDLKREVAELFDITD